MKHPINLSSLKSVDWLAARHLNRYEHRAMATLFEIFLYHQDSEYAAQAVQAAFAETDRLEQELSRYIDNSDISRINDLIPGESVKVGLDAFNCLQFCQQIYRQTQGAFDITVGTLVDWWRRQNPAGRLQKKIPNGIMEKTGLKYLVLDDDNYSVQVLQSGLHIDLGGVGKGFALDRMAAVLSEWGISRAMLHSGYSTVLALAAPANEEGWPVALKHPLSGEVIRYKTLIHSAISGSGIQKGAHIIVPGSGKAVEDNLAAWVTASTAALADALSTALMIMTKVQTEEFVTRYPEVAACILCKRKSQVQFIGQF